MDLRLKEIFLLVVLSFPFLVPAQKKEGKALTDSLLQEIAGKKDDTLKTKLYHAIAFSLYEIDPDSSLKYANLELALAEKLQYRRGIGSAYFIIGNVHSMKSNFAEALDYEMKALKIFEEAHNAGSANACYFSLAAIYSQQDRLPEALSMFYSVLKRAEASGNKVIQSKCHISIGNVYLKQDNLPEALKSYQAALEMAELEKLTMVKAAALQNISTVYHQTGKYEEALKYAQLSLRLSEELGDRYGLATCIKDIGKIYTDLGDYAKATGYYDRAVKMLTDLEAKQMLADALAGYADIYFRQKKYADAERYYKEVLALGRATSSHEVVKAAEDYLCQIYTLTGRHNEALIAYKGYIAARDSMNNEETTRKTVQTKMQYDFDKKEALTKAEQERKDVAIQMKLQQKNILIYGTLATLLVAVVIGLLLIRQAKLRANHQRVELEQKQLRAQMNPHFIFNCLNSIQHFVVANDVKNANKYLSGFASLMRQTLEDSKDGTITLRREITYLKNYLSLESMRFEDKFSYTISCAEDINIDTVELPSMIIQPFIENAIRHGLCYLQNRRGLLQVKFYLQETHLFCEIDDNGIGREQSQKLKLLTGMAYESHGMELTRKRLALVSKNIGSDYEIELTDKVNSANEPEGTTVTIKFPANT